MVIGDSSNSILYNGQWIQRSEYDRIMAQQQAEQQAAAEAARQQQQAQQAAAAQRVAELNPSTASFVKAVPGERGDQTVIMRYHSDTGQYDTIHYNSASAEMKRQADEYISSHESEFWNIPLEKRTGYVPQDNGYIDLSSVRPEMRVTVPGSSFDDNETRRVLSTLPNWTPVNLGGDSGNMDAFAYNGGIVNSRGEYYTEYGPASAGGVAAPSQADLDRVNNYINKQVNPTPKVSGAEKIDLSDMWAGKDTATRLSPEQLAVLEKGGTVNVTTKQGDITKDISITSSPVEQVKPQGFGENWNAGITEWEKGLVLPLGAPAWIVGDVLRTPGNMATMIGGVTGEAKSIGATALSAGPVAAGGKAAGDWWRWENDLALSLKADPARYFYNVGLGLVIGKGISKGIGVTGKAASGILKETGTVETYGSNMFKGTTRPFKTTVKTATQASEDAGPLADGFALLDDAVLPGKGITIKNAPLPEMLKPAPAGKGFVNQILAGYSRELPESYAPKKYYNTPSAPKVPGNSMVNKILAGYSKELPEAYMGNPKPYVKTIDLTRESQRLWQEDLAKTQKSAFGAAKVDMTRETSIGGVKYTGKPLFLDDEAAYGGLRQVMASPETIRYVKGAGNMFSSSPLLGSTFSLANMSGTIKPVVPKQKISVSTFSNRANPFTIITPDMSDLLGTTTKTNTRTTSDVLSLTGTGSGTPPTNKQTVGSGLAFALGGIAGVGALSYGRKLLLGSSMGIAPGYGSYKKMLKPGAKRGKYLTGDITGLLYGKKKGKKGKKKNSLYKGLL